MTEEIRGKTARIPVKKPLCHPVVPARDPVNPPPAIPVRSARNPGTGCGAGRGPVWLSIERDRSMAQVGSISGA